MATRGRGINIPVELDTTKAVQDLAKLTKSIVQANRIITNSNKNLNNSLKATTQIVRDEVRAYNSLNTVVSKHTKLTRKATSQVAEFERVQSKLSRTSKKLSGGLGEVSGLLRQGLSVAVLSGVAKGFFSASAQVETLETQFKTLLGSGDKAKERIKELSEFASKTPFKLEETAQASRVLQTLTKGALATGEGLRLVGDASATAGTDFKELAVHVGRAYDGLQSNRPIGEAMARMQELGLVTGDTRTQIEKLQKAGKGKEAWKVLEAELKKTKGGMEDLSQTTLGLWSTTQDLTNAFFRSVDAMAQSGGALKKLIGLANEYLEVASATYEAMAFTGQQEDKAKLYLITKELAVQEKLSRLKALGQKQEKEVIKNYISMSRLTNAINDMDVDQATVQNLRLKSRLRGAETHRKQLELSEKEKNILDEIIAKTKTALAINEKLKPKPLISPKVTPAEVVEGKGKGKGEATAKEIAEAEKRAKILEDTLGVLGSMREEIESITAGGSKPTEGIRELFKALEGNDYDPDKLNDRLSAGFDQLLNTEEGFSEKFFNKRKEFFSQQHTQRAKAHQTEIESIIAFNESKLELDRMLADETTGYYLEGIQRKGELEYAQLEEDYKQKYKLAEKHGKTTEQLEKNFAQKKRLLITETLKAQVDGTARASSMILNDLQGIFGETKALAIAEATIKGYQAMVNSFEFGTKIGGPILGGIMSGLSATATGVTIGKMSSQNFATGGMPLGANANVTMNERGQEAILNASATARLGRAGVDELNNGGSVGGVSSNGAPKTVTVTYNPTINFTGETSPDLFATLEDDLERVGDLVGQAVRRGYANV